MKLTYDPRRNIAYLRLQEKGPEVETIRISEELNVDLAPDGTVYGIELLNANEQLQASDDGALIVVNEAIGERRELRLIHNIGSDRQGGRRVKGNSGPGVERLRCSSIVELPGRRVDRGRPDFLAVDRVTEARLNASELQPNSRRPADRSLHRLSRVQAGRRAVDGSRSF